MEHKALFAATGSKTGVGSTTLLTLVVLGVIGSLTMLIVAGAVPKAFGSPLIYLATLAASIGLGVWVFKSDKVEIQIVDDGQGRRAVIRGPATRIDEPLQDGGEHWVSFERLPIRMGGGTLVRYSVLVRTKKGRTLGFNLRAGSQGTEPPDWPQRDQALADGDDVFLCIGIRGLPAALRGELPT